MAYDVAFVAIFLAAEITQVIDSILWVRCASGNVLSELGQLCAWWDTAADACFIIMIDFITRGVDFCGRAIDIWELA